MLANGSTGPLKLKITNEGSQTAAGTVRIDLYLSSTQNSVPSGATSMQHVTRVIRLTPGKSAVVAIPGFKFPAGLEPPQDFIVAQLTGIKGITEIGNGDSINSTASSIKIARRLLICRTYTPAHRPHIVPGRRAALVVPVINNGNVAAHGIATITIIASTNSSGSGGTNDGHTIKRPILLGVGKTAKLNHGLFGSVARFGALFCSGGCELAGRCERGKQRRRQQQYVYGVGANLVFAHSPFPSHGGHGRTAKVRPYLAIARSDPNDPPAGMRRRHSYMTSESASPKPKTRPLQATSRE